MRKRFKYFATIALANIFSVAGFAQTTVVKGIVRNNTTSEVVSAASVTLKGSGSGTFTDDKGNFTLTTTQKFPLTLVISSIGFETQEVTVNGSSDISVDFKPTSVLGQEVIIAATRTPTRILESPVSIERVSTAAIRNAASPSYYDVLGGLKGVDITTSSFAFKTPSTRGFNGSGNLRFNQLVDGMDNQAPALNFAVGSIIGLTELDVESMELLPGASSALYGSGGTNGTLLINSKDPFKYQGLSFQIKQGINHIDNYERRGAPYTDWTVRWAKKIGDKFAFKIGAQLVQAQDWQGNDQRGLSRNNVFSSLKPNSDRLNDPNYDGINVFGDEISGNLNAFAQVVRGQLIAGGGAGVTGAVNSFIGFGLTPLQIAAQFAANPGLAPFSNLLPFLIPTATVANNPYANTFNSAISPNVSRTGYQEKDLVNYNAYNVRFSGGANYKINDKIEASFLGYTGAGTSVYTGADRYSLKDLRMGQYKLELKSKNWFLRGYTTQENSGNSYTATTAAFFINNSWKSNATWFQQYVGTYGQRRLFLGASDQDAHTAARAVAETGRFLPGTPGFNAAFENAKNTNVSAGGAKFADKSSLYHYEGQLNLTDQVRFAEMLVGASFRQYNLNSKGTIFADTSGVIKLNEYGTYVQLQKKILNDVLKLTGTVRYDKHENFEGRFTPRFTAVVKVAKDNNIRMSYQTAYRFPSTQDQYINLLTGGVNRLIGGLESFNTFYKFDVNPAYTVPSTLAYRASFNAGSPNPALLVPATFKPIKPESTQSFELGYKGLVTKKLLIDAYGYYSKYKDFISRTGVFRGKDIPGTTPQQTILNPFTSDNISFVINTTTPVKATGFGFSADYNFYKNFVLSGNYSGDKLKDVPAGVITFFNTPEWRYNIGLSNTNVYKGVGFNVTFRRQAENNWEGTFGSGLVPAYETLDAMVSYKLKSSKSLIKIGSTNFFNHYYRSAFGNPQVGGLYYISFGYNVF